MFGISHLMVGLRRAMTDWVSSGSEVSLDAGIEHTGPVSALPAFDALPLRRPAHTIASVGARQHQRFAGLAVTISALVLNVANVYNWIVTPVEALEYGARRRFRLIVTAERLAATQPNRDL